MTPLPSDARLAHRASEGDPRAFAAIYKRYHQSIYRFCLSIVGRPEDAQDALQSTMVKALRALPNERREIQLKPWLYRVAHNESVDLLRRRREGPELDSEQTSGAVELAETVALRERLGSLLADLGELPERQRSALVMRELGGLDYQQIGAAFESTAAVARQTVYEARLGLRELERGREMSCEQVKRRLSEADGRVRRRRDLRAHLRGCQDCRAFRDSIDSRRRDLAALTPLPAAAAASILHGLAGGGKVAASGGLGGVGAAAGAGKVAGTSVAVKTMATVAVVATVGVTAADRGGLIDVGLPDGGKSAREAPASSGATDPVGPGTGTSTEPDAVGGPVPIRQADLDPTPKEVRKQAGDGSGSAASAQPEAATTTQSPAGDGGGPPATLPEASRHGQETAAAHKAGDKGKAKGPNRQGATGKGNSGGRGNTQGKSKSKPHASSPVPSKGGHGKQSQAPVGSPAKSPPEHAEPPGKVENGMTKSNEPSAGEPSEPESTP